MVIPDSNPRTALMRGEEAGVCPVLSETLAIVGDGCELAAKDLASYRSTAKQ